MNHSRFRWEGFKGRQVRGFSMSEDSQETRGLIDVNSLPEPVRRMAEVMTGLDPEWTINGWLTQQAEQTLALLRHDLKRERLLLEQRKFRLDDLERRISPDQEKDEHQMSIFDCFGLDEDNTFTGLSQRGEKQRVEEGESHGAEAFIELLPDEQGDDPLLAVACQLVVMIVDGEIEKGEPVATLEAIFERMLQHGVEDVEIDEAIDYLLTTGGLIEVDDDCFISTI
tara:strand:- start:221 stop:898 length:678 start_codon:yes stop_codon:yes gene_type:complete